MAQYGGDQQYRKEEGHQHTEDGTHINPLHSTTAGHQIESTGTAIHSTTAGHEIGGTGTTIGTGAGHGGYEQEKHAGGILHRSGSGSSSSSESDGEGGRRKKKGVVEKIKEKLPGGTDHGAGGEHKTTSAAVGYEGEEAGHEKKGLMEKIKEKLPGGTH